MAGSLAALACAALIVGAARGGAADALGKLAHQRLLALEGRADATVESYAPVLAQAERALSLDPGNPHLLELAGMIRTRSVAREPASALWTRAALTDARERLRAAQAARPVGSYTQAYLAAAKYRLGEENAELNRALAGAMRQGGHEPQIQALVAEIGLHAWDRLDRPAADATRTALARLVRRDLRHLERLLARSDRAAQACAALGPDGAAVAACARIAVCGPASEKTGMHCDGD